VRILNKPPDRQTYEHCGKTGAWEKKPRKFKNFKYTTKLWFRLKNQLREAEADCRLLNQQIRSLLWQPKFHYRAHEMPPLNLILGHIHASHFVTSGPLTPTQLLFPMIPTNLTFRSSFVATDCTHSYALYTRRSATLPTAPVQPNTPSPPHHSYLPAAQSEPCHACYMPRPTQPGRSDHANNVGEQRTIQTTKLPVMHLPPASCRSLSYTQTS
jgi:hypothetical protein